MGKEALLEQVNKMIVKEKNRNVKNNINIYDTQETRGN